MNRTGRFVSAFMVVVLLVSLGIRVLAESQPAVKLKLVSSAADVMAGDTVDLSLNYADSKGFEAIYVKLSFDSAAFEPIYYSGSLFHDAAVSYPQAKYKVKEDGTATISFDGLTTNAIKGSGTVVQFGLKVKADAPVSAKTVSLVLTDQCVCTTKDGWLTATAESPTINIRGTRITSGGSVTYDTLPKAQFTVETRTPDCKTAMLAGYDAKGMLNYIDTKTIGQDQTSVQFSLDNQDGRYREIRVFLLIENSVPLYAARVITAETN